MRTLAVVVESARSINPISTPTKGATELQPSLRMLAQDLNVSLRRLSHLIDSMPNGHLCIRRAGKPRLDGDPLLIVRLAQVQQESVRTTRGEQQRVGPSRLKQAAVALLSHSWPKCLDDPCTGYPPSRHSRFQSGSYDRPPVPVDVGVQV